MDSENLTGHSLHKQLICSGCGAKLVFEPNSERLSCEYCGSSNIIEEKQEAIKENDLVEALNNASVDSPTVDVLNVKCDSCSAVTVFDENVVSNSCAFCGSPIVLKNATTNKLFQPKAILPFSVDKLKANVLHGYWLDKIWWAPFGFKKRVHSIEALSGIYIPYWTYDANTDTSYVGQRGDNYMDTETYTTVENGRSVVRQRSVVRTRWSSCSGRVVNFFDDVLVNASKSLPVEKTQQLEPWDLEKLVPFDDAYLSGFRTECYQVDLKEGFEMARLRIEESVRELICSDIGGDHQRISHSDTQYSELSFKHILLPIWLSSYRYKNKSYRYLVNGRTGEVQGEYPISVMKIVMVVAIVAVVVLAIALSV